DLQTRVDQLRVKYKFSDNPPDASETVRNLEKRLSEANNRYTHFQKRYDVFSTKSRDELRRAIPTAAPDQAMDRYLADLAKVEQHYASNIGDLGPQHPEIVKLEALRKKID